MNISKSLPGIALLSLSLLAPSFAVGCGSAIESSEQGDEGELRDTVSMKELLAKVPPGTPWKDVKPEIKRALEQNADVYFARVRHDWGTKGLDEKAERVVESPSPAMTQNFDRVMKHLLAADVPEDFVASTGIANDDLLVQLKRLYVLYCAERQHLLPSANPELKDWDGGPVNDFLIRDEKATEQQKAFAREIEKKVKAIPATALSDVEKAVVYKLSFVIRQMKYGATGFNSGGDDTRGTGTTAGWLYDVVAFNGQVPGGAKLFEDEEELLLAVNAHTFQNLLYGNVGTVDTFAWDLANYVDPEFMKSQGFDPETNSGAKGYLTLVGWWKERVTSSKEAKAKCTVYSAKERQSLWDAFTADNFTNADGKESFQSYATTYQSTIAARLAEMKEIGSGAVDAAFPTPASGLTAAEKAQVKQKIAALTKPALIVETIVEALDAATGNKTASAAFTAKQTDLTMIGGNYQEGEALRAADKATVEAMWSDVKTFVATRYAGKPVDIAKLLPQTIAINTGEMSYAGADANGGANLTIGLGKEWNKASLFLTLLHEGKHAIDIASKATVLGAAWEGAATTTEQMVGEDLVASAMASEQAKLPFYRLGTAVDNVRLTATTDATIKVFLRGSCGGNAPDSIQFAKDVVASYGYSDEDTLLLRARRAHMGTQYLSYDYGNVAYRDVLTYLQGQINAPAVVVDPMLLQACGMPSPNKDAAAVAKLRSCLKL